MNSGKINLGFTMRLFVQTDSPKRIMDYETSSNVKQLTYEVGIKSLPEDIYWN